MIIYLKIINLQLVGEYHSLTAESYGFLANLYGDIKESNKSIDMNLKALKIFEMVLF